MLSTRGSADKVLTLILFRNLPSTAKGKGRLIPDMRVLENNADLYISYRWKSIECILQANQLKCAIPI